MQFRFGHDHAAVVAGFSFAIADVTAQPGCLRTPIDVLVRLPNVLAAAAETESPEAHRFQRDVAGENDEVGP